jgi:hypothetical protein
MAGRIVDAARAAPARRILSPALDVVSYRPEPSEFAWTFGGVPPVRTVRPGDVLELWTEDAFGGKVRGPGDWISHVIEFPFVNPQTGPFFIEGAEPGDTLAMSTGSGMCEEYGFEKLDAYQLLMQVSESPVANVCHPNYTFLTKVAKRYLPRVLAYRGTHARLRETCAAYLGER